MDSITATPTKPMPGPKVIIIGDVGSGKTYSLRTLLEIDPSVEVFTIFTEPGMETIGDCDAARMHWAYVSPGTASWESLMTAADNINKLSYEGLSKLSATDKSQYRAFYDMLKLLTAPVCERCGKKFDMVDKWPNSRILVIDSLSGVSTMASNIMVGSKPTRHEGEWGVSMSMIDGFVTRLFTGIQCPVILTAHPEREQDMITGQVKVMASTLGRKLSPKLPRNASDVIYIERDGTKFWWNTASSIAVTKARNLPIADKQPPSFVPLFTNWMKQGGKLG